MIWRRTDQVSPELALAVFSRDRDAMADYLAEFGFETKWQRDRLIARNNFVLHVVCPAVYINLHELGNCWGRWRIEHVKKAARFGKRAEPEMARLMAICEGHAEPGMKAGAIWVTAHRQECRDYLENVRVSGEGQRMIHPFTCAYCTGSASGNRPAWSTQEAYDAHMAGLHFGLRNEPQWGLLDDLGGPTIHGIGTKEGAVAAWCSTHNDLAWLYEDGSVGCYYDAVTESHNEHDAAPLSLNLAR